ncbi:hypothetical protein [Clostridium folliculivorans]|uniref:hypothetical protein n=1 Tax=Clostridium folliculivorans TaxID=2886038 RepID=UPI0021C4153B|nr:hypothetical protein [Clostridium folliculivorans]GKU29323.1 hypothetical protein CFB3_14290 [Clostridium folliculivorans]
MPYIMADRKLLRKLAKDFKKINSNLKDINREFDLIKNKLDWDIESKPKIDLKFKQISDEMSKEAEDLKKLLNFIDNVCDEYDKCEKEIDVKGVSLGDNKQDSDKDKSIISDMLTWFSGPKGIILSSVLPGAYTTLLVANHYDKNKWDILKDGTAGALDYASKTLGEAKSPKAGAWADEVVDKVDDLVGAKKTNAVKFPKAAAWGKKFTEEINDNIDDIVSPKNKKIGAVSRASLAFSAIVNGIDNYKDYKDGKQSAVRAIEETVMETAVGLVIGAAVVATLPASAPALAVVAATTAITIGLDSVTEQLTKSDENPDGKGLTEVVSDFILDNGEKGFDYLAGSCKRTSKDLKAAWV